MTRIRKILTGGLAALTLGMTVAATSTPAAAWGRWGGGYGWHGGGWGGPGPWVAGAIGGLALGAIASGAAGGYGCVANRPVYDPYGNFVGYQRVRVACY